MVNNSVAYKPNAASKEVYLNYDSSRKIVTYKPHAASIWPSKRGHWPALSGGHYLSDYRKVLR